MQPSEYRQQRFVHEKRITGKKFSEWILKLFIGFSLSRLIISCFKMSFFNIETGLSILLLSLLLLLQKYAQTRPKFQSYIGYFIMFFLQPLSVLHSFWLHPEYGSLYAMAHTIRLYYGILEVVSSYRTGIFIIVIHLASWIAAGICSGIMPIPDSLDVCLSITIVIFFHIVFFRHRFLLLEELLENKIVLEKKENLITSIVQAIPEGISVIDYSCHNLLMNSAYRILISDLSTLEYLPQHKNQKSFIKATLIEDIREFIQSTQEKIVFGIVNAKPCKVEVTATKIQWDLIPAVILTFRDVTGLIKLEKEIVQNSSLLHCLRGVSHELKTPINVITNKIKTLADRCQIELQEDLKICISSAEVLLLCVKSIMDYSSYKLNKSVQNITEVNIINFLEECISLCCSYNSLDNNAVTLQIAEYVPEIVSMDSSRLKQVIVSLLCKAINVSSEKLITINVSLKEHLFSFFIKFHCSASTVSAFISNIESEDDAKVKVNSGLLHEITRKIIRHATGKNLNAKFKPPNRFSFTFEYPIQDSITSLNEDFVPDEGSKMYPWPPLRISLECYEKVLIVDDMPINIQIAGCMLNKLKVEWIGVTSGKDTINELTKYSKSTQIIKIVLLDCMMPDMDGWETAKSICNLYRDGKINALPFIIGHSAFENCKDIQKCYEAGMDDFLPKPSDAQTYCNAISKWLSQPLRHGQKVQARLAN